MKKKDRYEPVRKVRVIRKTSDARYDYYLEIKRAEELYAAGKLAWDVTNGCYTSCFTKETLTPTDYIGEKLQ